MTEEFPKPNFTPAKNLEKKIKEGVDFVFEQNLELERVGTKEQYSEYLDTIFPNSKVKDILYHGTKDNISNFNKNEEGIFFSLDKEYAKLHGVIKSNYYDVNDTSTYTHNVIAVIVNIKNPEYPQISISTRKGHTNYFNPKDKKDNVDGVIGKDAYAESKGNSVVVFEPEQLHILGSDQDLENFKTFVQDEKSNMLVFNNG